MMNLMPTSTNSLSAAWRVMPKSRKRKKKGETRTPGAVRMPPEMHELLLRLVHQLEGPAKLTCQKRIAAAFSRLEDLQARLPTAAVNIMRR